MKLKPKLSLISFLIIAGVTIPGLLLLFLLVKQTYLEKTAALLHAGIQANITIPIQHMRRAESSLQTLARELKRTLQAPPRPEEIAEFDALVTTDKFGVIRNNPQFFDGSRQAGVFIPADVTLTDKVKRTKLRAMKLLSSYGLASLQFFDGLWFDQADKTSVIFWRRDPDFIYKLPPDHDYTQTLWDRLASPELNPERQPKWTPAILESPVGVWVVSCVYPLDIEGRWEGVLGHDIALTELISSFRHVDRYPSSEHFLVDSFGNFILAGPWQTQLEQKTGEFKPDMSAYPQLQTLLSRIDTSQAQTTLPLIHIKGIDYLAIPVYIPALDWHYLRLVSVKEILAPMQRLFLLLAGLIFLIALLTALLMQRAITRLFIQPLLDFSTMLHRYGNGEHALRLHYKSQDELAEVAQAINHMADNIALQHRQLQRSHLRYQQVVNSIEEIIFKLDLDGQILFINDAWETISHLERHQSYLHNLREYIHPDAAPDFANILKQLPSQKDFHGELKLRNAQHQPLWVDINMYYVIENTPFDDESREVVIGNMSDISERKFSQLAEQLLAQIEQESFQSVNCDYLLGLFCYHLTGIFSLPLAWIITADADSSQVLASAGKDIHYLHRYHQTVLKDLDTVNATLSADPETTVHFISHDHDFDRFAVPLTIPGYGKSLLFFHAQAGEHLSPHQLAAFSTLFQKLGHLLQQARDHHWMRLLRTALENIANAVFITDASGKIEWCNAAFITLSGYTMDDVIGQTPHFLKSGQHAPEFYAALWQTLLKQRPWHGEVINRRRDGSFFTVSQTITPLVDARGITTHYVAVQEDITELKAIEQQTQFMATHDFLTKLPNRYLVRERLQHALDVAARTGNQHALLFLDLDDFKIINDSLGHQIGDQILQQFAARLSQMIRVSDTLARIGGDEFLIVIENFQHVDAVSDYCQKILDSFSQPFDINGNKLQLSTSIGIAIYPDDAGSVDELIRSADSAMYHAKEKGRNRYEFFTSELGAAVQHRYQLEQDLRFALSHQQLVLYYQPQMNTQTQTVIGMEALIRWQHPDEGLIPPNQFIPFAEDSGLIVEIGHWVFRQACEQAQAWHDAGYTDLNISVNVSVKQLLHSEFLSQIRQTLEATRVNPGLITIELTESIMVKQPQAAISLLNELKKLGLKLSIDDFGTGYSSLQYLRLLPLDELKIDQSFIRDIEHEDGMAIIETICTLGHAMGLSLIAEGVEYQSVVTQLNQLGCYHAQGYLYSRPLPLSAADPFLQQFYSSAKDKESAD